VSGSSGYGIRDKAGTLEFKNDGGSWDSLQNIVYDLKGGGGESSDGRIGSFISETTVTNTGGNKTQNIAIPSNLFSVPQIKSLFLVAPGVLKEHI
jgi:hypothetical protein